MAVIDPTPNRPLAVQVGQPLRFVADDTLPRNWFVRVNGGSWTLVSLLPTNTFVWTPTSVVNHLTFDRVDVGTSANPLVTPTAAAFTLDLCEGPPAVLWATSAIRDEAQEEPPLRPWDGESDDPPLGTPFVLPGANRDRFGTVLLETVAEPGGPANLIALYGPGLFVDTAGKLGARTTFMSDVRGLGPFPPIASYHHGGLYFNHDFGKSRTLALTRVLYEDAGGHVAVVRGDGRRNTYRSLGGGAFEAAAGLRNTLAKAGGFFTETTPSGRVYRYTAVTGGGTLDRVIDARGTTAYYAYDANARLQKINGIAAGALGLVPYLSYDASGLLTRLVLEDPATPANNRATYFEYDGVTRNLSKIVGPESCVTYFAYTGADRLLASVTDPENYTWRAGYDASERVERIVDALSPGKAAYFAYDPAVPAATWKDRAGRVTYFQFNAWGSPERVFSLGVPVPDYYAYDTTYGFLKDSTNRLLKRWTYEVEAAGLNRLSATDPLGARSYFAYDAQDLLRFQIDPVQRFTYLDYDASRNRTRWIDPLGATAYYEYEATGLRRLKRDRRGSFTYFAWDGRGNLSKVDDALGHATYFDHDPAGERSAQVDALGRISYFEHDKRGRLTKRTDPVPAATYFAYDARCNLVLQTDARLNATSHEYDGNGNRTKTVDALGDATYFAFDPEERLASRKDALFNDTQWTYDALGRRQKQIDALGFETYFAYDAAHQLERQVNARGYATYLRYDAAGRSSHRKDATLVAETYLGYDLAGERVLALDARSNHTYFQYDPRGWLRRTETAIGAATYFAFDAEGNRLRSVDPLGQTTYFTFDPAGRLTHTEDQLGGVTYVGYDRANQTTLRVDPLGFPTYLTYDPAGRVATTFAPSGLLTYHQYDRVGNLTLTNLEQGYGNQPYGSSPYGGERSTTTSSYDAVNRRVESFDAYSSKTYLAHDRVSNLERSIDARGFATYFRYDKLNRRTHTKDPVHFTESYLGYDPVGNVVRQVDPQGATTYFSFDEVDRTSFSVDPAGALTYHSYDPNGNRTVMHVLLGVAGERRSTYFQYDPVNRVVRQIAPDLGETYHEYDKANNQKRLVDPMGRPTYMAYDALNRETTRANAFGDAWTTEYDKRSSPTRRLDPEGRATYLGYDPPGRLLHQSNALGQFTYFFHDARGQRTHLWNARGYSTYFRYDLLGRQTHKIDALGGVSYMAYDAVGNQTLAQDELLNATYFFFDGLSRVTRVMDATLKSSYMDYDSRSSMTKRVDADGRASYFAFDVAARVDRQFFTTPVAGETAESPAYFVYDQVSNLKIVDDRLAGLGVTYFDHDKLDRLTKKVTVAGAVYYAYDLSGMKSSLKDPDLEENAYVYDAAGRMTALQVAAGRTAYYHHDRSGMVTKRLQPGNDVMAYMAYDSAGRLSSLVNRNPVNGVLTSSEYVRDPNGQITKNTQQFGQFTYYEYDPLDRLTRELVKDASSTTLDNGYTYDEVGNRLKKSAKASPTAETYYAYDALNLVWREHVLSGATTYYDYDAAQRMKTQRSSSEATYFAHDPHGQIMEVKHAAASPDPLQRFSYNAAGERVRVSEGSREAYWSWDDAKLMRERLSTDVTYYRYRHNESNLGCMGQIAEIEAKDMGATQTVHPAFNECGSVVQLATANELPEIFTYDIFGLMLSDQGSGAKERMRFSTGTPFLALGTTQNLYLTPRGLYLPRIALTTAIPWGGSNIPEGQSIGGFNAMDRRRAEHLTAKQSAGNTSTAEDAELAQLQDFINGKPGVSRPPNAPGKDGTITGPRTDTGSAPPPSAGPTPEQQEEAARQRRLEEIEARVRNMTPEQRRAEEERLRRATQDARNAEEARRRAEELADLQEILRRQAAGARFDREDEERRRERERLQREREERERRFAERLGQATTPMTDAERKRQGPCPCPDKIPGAPPAPPAAGFPRVGGTIVPGTGEEGGRPPTGHREFQQDWPGGSTRIQY